MRQMPAFGESPAAYLSALLTLGAALLFLSPLVSQEKQEKTEEEIHAEQSRQLLEAFHCSQSDPAAVRAFAGCWKIASVWGPPSEKNLKLGMRLSEHRAQLSIDSYDAYQAANSVNPRYCIVEGISTLAPYPDADLSREFTYVYSMQEIPPREVQGMAHTFHKLLAYGDENVSLTDYEEFFAAFVKNGGKYILTWIVQEPTHVWWDSDAEEDFWALPVSCDGWKEIEELFKEEMKED